MIARPGEGDSTLQPLKRKYQKVDPCKYKIQYVVDVDPSGVRTNKAP